MKRLALVLMLLTLTFAAQAQDYEEEIILYCVWPDGRIESFMEGGSYGSPIGLSGVWTVASIRQYPAAIRVRLKSPNRERVITFNNGWPCRLEVSYEFINHEETKPESDNFNQID